MSDPAADRSPQRTGPRPHRSRPRVRTVAIVGAGTMGVQIAAANVRCRLPVVLTDSNPMVVADAVERIAFDLTDDSDTPLADLVAQAGRLISVTDDLARIGGCDLVLESISENAEAKRRLLAELEPQLGPLTILATNTSTLPIARLGEDLRDPSRFCGLHFFHPVRCRPLVEIVRGPRTSDQTIAIARAYSRALGKTPLVVNDGPGFLVNRLLVPYLSEAWELLLEGATSEQIESAAIDFGMSLGPLRLADEIGLDTVLQAGRVLWEAFPERVEPSPLLLQMYKAGRFGRKVGKGFFTYRQAADGRLRPCPDPWVKQTVSFWARDSRSFTSDQIITRLLSLMVLEATRVLEEQRVASPRAIDAGTVLGLGFPASRGGLLRWADQQGAAQVLAMLQQSGHLGARAKPTLLLQDMARRGAFFHRRRQIASHLRS